jgi:hypothetical protein
MALVASAPIEGSAIIGIAVDRLAEEAARIEWTARQCVAAGHRIAPERLVAAREMGMAQQGYLFILAKGQDLTLRGEKRSVKQSAQLALIRQIAKEMRAVRAPSPEPEDGS